jgi:hypothetical protein
MWSMAYPIEGESEFVNRTALSPIAIEEAEFDFREYNNGEGVQDLSDQVVYQDWQLNAGQKSGWRSRGFRSRIWLLRKQGCGAFMRF